MMRYTQSVGCTCYRHKTVSARLYSDGVKKLVVVAPVDSPLLGKELNRDRVKNKVGFDAAWDQLMSAGPKKKGGC